MKSSEALHLLVLDDSANLAERVSSMLRNEGYAVRAVRAQDDEELREALGAQHWDMILAPPTIPYFSALDALDIIREMEVDVPLLLIDNKAEREKLIEALRAGARAVLSLDDPALVTHTVMRERHDLQQRLQHRQCQQRLEEANDRSQGLVDSSRDAIAYVHDGMHIYANESYLQMFGYSEFLEIEGMPVMDLVAAEDKTKFKAFLRQYSKGTERRGSFETTGQRADGEPFELVMELSPASYEGEVCTQIIIRDQSANAELERRLDLMSKQDLLTGTYNRQYFLDKLGRVMSNNRQRGAVLFIEPDNFAKLRDEFGIVATDVILADLAGVLKKSMRESDILARFEAHQFTALLPGVSEAEATALTDKLVRRVADFVTEVAGRHVTLTASVGICAFNEGVSNPNQVVERAEKAQKKVASGEGNGYHSYNPAAEEMEEKELTAVWSTRIKTALRDNHFQLVYQPIVSLRGDTTEHYEVLLRLRDEEGNTVSPSEFLPEAQKAGLLTAIDRWVLGNTIKMMALRQRSGHKTNFFIKLSSESLRDTRLLPWLRDLLKAAKVHGNQLILEVSEKGASGNLKMLRMLAEGLSQLRVRIAIDHFGLAANYENLLKHVPSHFLKIDGSLIDDLAKNPEHQAKLREITSMASKEGRLTIAEFVESASTLAALWTCGVDYIQGYFLQEPTPELTYDFTSEF